LETQLELVRTASLVKNTRKRFIKKITEELINLYGREVVEPLRFAGSTAFKMKFELATVPSFRRLGLKRGLN